MSARTPQAPATEPFPWDEAMRFGLGLLRLPPNDFWRMTPRELKAAMSAFGRPDDTRFASTDLARLMRAFPDEADTRA